MAMEGGPSGWDVGGIIGGAVAVLGLVGHAIAWVFRRGERSADSIDRKEAAYVTRLEGRLAALEAKDSAREAENRQLSNRITAVRMAFEIVAGVIRRTDPANAELRRAETILEAAFPIDLATPADMIVQLKRVDK